MIRQMHFPTMCAFVLLSLTLPHVCGLRGEASAQQVISKRCSHCQSLVPIWSQVGNTCPKCSAVWSYEEETYSGSSSNSANANVPNAMQFLAFWHSILQQQKLTKELERQSRVHQRVEAIRKLLGRKLRIREDVRRKLILKAEEFRANDDPEKRAEQHLTSGLRCEEEGDVKAARAYFKLVLRHVPDSTSARTASAALARISLPIIMPPKITLLSS